MPVKKKKKAPKRKPLRKKRRIDLDISQIDALLNRAESGKLEKNDVETIKAMAECIVFLSQSVDEKAIKIKRLLRMIFGASTETKDNVLGNTDTETVEEDPEEPALADEPQKDNAKGHGRNGADDYPGAERVNVTHPELKPDDPCPKCKEGKLYRRTQTGIEIRVTGSAPLKATVYELEKLRCNLCGTLFTAPLPESAGNKKYNASAAAMIALLKYGSGLPFNRLEGLQANLGVPLPSSTQWDIINKEASSCMPAYKELLYQAAQSESFFNDDTTMKIQTLIKENQEKDPARKGMFTTGIVAADKGRKIALFFTGRNHAGENMDEVLSHREQDLSTPLQMCDALSRNEPKEFKVILIHCLVHARRQFVDVSVNFPDECAFVINTLAKVYHYDAVAKEMEMSAGERLRFHQQNSKRLMDSLLKWLKEQIDEHKVEPNSGLGDAVMYMLNHWKELTRFLKVPGADLDNNVAERALKKAILNRKNSLFYKSEHGAAVGDMYMSLIYTCELAGVNPMEYLTALIEYPELVSATPSKWMPWNYIASLPQQSTHTPEP